MYVYILRSLTQKKTVPLTWFRFRSEGKNCQRDEKWQVQEQVDDVDPHPKLPPLVVEKTAHQRMLQEIKGVRIDLQMETLTDNVLTIEVITSQS